MARSAGSHWGTQEELLLREGTRGAASASLFGGGGGGGGIGDGGGGGGGGSALAQNHRVVRNESMVPRTMGRGRGSNRAERSALSRWRRGARAGKGGGQGVGARQGGASGAAAPGGEKWYRRWWDAIG